ncbi:MAG: DUF5916 domain-containing protein [Woeseiaceae bacterium]|nr:DUF5916 domain-containing protein [Woeseiaceae bacterium]
MKGILGRAGRHRAWPGGLLLCLVAATSGAQQTAGPASPRPSTQAYPLDGTPTLDGDVLGDAAWQRVQPTGDFWQIQPAEGRPASQQTEVYIGYTDDALYIGVVAYDENPAGIIVTDSRRDSPLDDTDSFQVVIDGLHDRQNGFVFGTNPAGIEYDGQVTREGSNDFSSGGGGFNLNWDASWNVQAQISDIGWSAEFRIPFRTLRYGTSDDQVWGINFQRNIRRNNEVAFWAPLSRQRNLYRVSEAGTVSGISPPPQRNLKVTPYVLGKAERGGMLDGTETDQEFGFDVKYSITPSLTLDATYNTDFAQVEADEQQVNLDRFSLFFPEKRPFFLENAGLFAVGNPEQVELFFSRRIGVGPGGTPIPIDGGVRLSGKVGGSTNVGFLHMAAEGVDGIAPANDFTVARVSQELANRSSIGMLVVNREGDGSLLGDASLDENQTYAIDGRWGVGDNLLFEAWAAKTDTRQASPAGDDAFAVKADYQLRDLVVARVNSLGGPRGLQPGSRVSRAHRVPPRRVLRHAPHPAGRHVGAAGDTPARVVERLLGFRRLPGNRLPAHRFALGMAQRARGAYRHEFHEGRCQGAVRHRRRGHGIAGHVRPRARRKIVFFTDQSAPWSFSLRGCGRTIRWRPFHAGTDGAVSYRRALQLRAGGQLQRLRPAGRERPILCHPDTAAAVLLVLTPQKMLLQALVQHNDSTDVLATNLRFSWLQSANSGLYVVYNEVDERGIGAPPRGRELIIKYGGHA